MMMNHGYPLHWLTSLTRLGMTAPSRLRYTLSTMSICSIEDVAGAVGKKVLVPAVRYEGPWLRAFA
jgi:hypothetical protein